MSRLKRSLKETRDLKCRFWSTKTDYKDRKKQIENRRSTNCLTNVQEPTVYLKSSGHSEIGSWHRVKSSSKNSKSTSAKLNSMPNALRSKVSRSYKNSRWRISRSNSTNLPGLALWWLMTCKSTPSNTRLYLSKWRNRSDLSRSQRRKSPRRSHSKR